LAFAQRADGTAWQRPRRAQTWRASCARSGTVGGCALPGRAPDCACRSPPIERKTDEPCFCFDTLKLLLTDRAAAGEGDGHERAQCKVVEVRRRAAVAHRARGRSGWAECLCGSGEPGSAAENAAHSPDVTLATRLRIGRARIYDRRQGDKGVSSSLPCCLPRVGAAVGGQAGASGHCPRCPNARDRLRLKRG
jgi:hypothetical protein